MADRKGNRKKFVGRFQGGKDLRVEDVEDPKSCGPRQVVVKHAYCGWGGMAERCLVYDYNVAKLPPEVSDEQGAMIEPAAVAVNAIEHGDLTAGETILITGGGPIEALLP